MALLGSCIVGTSIAQAQGDRLLLQTVVMINVKPEHSSAFESELAAHNAWLKVQGDAWDWEVWQVLAGTDRHAYVIRSGDYSWQDFEMRATLASRADEQWRLSIGPLLTSSSSSILIQRPELSRVRAADAVAPLVYTNRLAIRYDRMADFLSVLPALSRAMTDSEYMFFNWSQLYAGGEQYVLHFDFPKQSWIDNNPPGVPFWTMIEQVYGAAEALRMREIWFSSIEEHRTGMLLHRDDLGTP